MIEVTRRQWGAHAPNRARVRLEPRSRPGIEVHHSVGLYGASTFEKFLHEVQRDHLGRGWTDGFYNLAIWTDGTIGELRGTDYKSGPISNLTVCLAGNFDHDELTDAHERALIDIRQWLLDRNAGATDIAYHARRDAVSCPGRNVIPWLVAGMPFDDDQEDDMAQHTAELASIALNTKAAAEEAQETNRLLRASTSDAVRRLRAECGLDPSPESDELWAGWIADGERTWRDAHERFITESS